MVLLSKLFCVVLLSTCLSIVCAIPRDVSKVLKGESISQAQGIRIHRTLGTKDLTFFDPFLVVDEVRMLSGRGLEAEPQRGYSSWTYVVEGFLRHQDNLGNEAVVNNGGLQIMTAPKTVNRTDTAIRSTRAVQIWINLPKVGKEEQPLFWAINASDIPEAATERQDVWIKVISGTAMGVTAPKRGAVDLLFLDVVMGPGTSFNQSIASTHNGIVYVLEGRGKFGSSQTTSHIGDALLFTEGDVLTVSCEPLDVVESGASLRFLLIAAEPIGEPTVRDNYFVMNTQDELDRVIAEWKELSMEGAASTSKHNDEL